MAAVYRSRWLIGILALAYPIGGSFIVFVGGLAFDTWRLAYTPLPAGPLGWFRRWRLS
jgi:hypothetical protein